MTIKMNTNFFLKRFLVVSMMMLNFHAAGMSSDDSMNLPGFDEGLFSASDLIRTPVLAASDYVWSWFTGTPEVVKDSIKAVNNVTTTVNNVTTTVDNVAPQVFVTVDRVAEAVGNVTNAVNNAPETVARVGTKIGQGAIIVAAVAAGTAITYNIAKYIHGKIVYTPTDARYHSKNFNTFQTLWSKMKKISPSSIFSKSKKIEGPSFGKGYLRILANLKKESSSYKKEIENFADNVFKTRSFSGPVLILGKKSEQIVVGDELTKFSKHYISLDASSFLTMMNSNNWKSFAQKIQGKKSGEKTTLLLTGTKKCFQDLKTSFSYIEDQLSKYNIIPAYTFALENTSIIDVSSFFESYGFQVLYTSK